MRTWILGLLLVIVGLASALGLWLLGYHLTGKSAFQHWKAERIAMGDRFDWKALAPPPVAPEQNFAEAPLVRGSIVAKGKVDARFKALTLPKGAEAGLGNWMEGRRDDLVAITTAYGTTDLQTVFKPMEPIFRDLDQATRRTGNRFPLAYEEGEIPALLGFRAAMRTLRVRALANLRSGHPDLALEDLQTCLRFADHLKAEPHLISALLRAATLNIALQVAWEGLEDRLWTAPQLTVMQADLARMDLLASLKLAWQAERSYGIAQAESLAGDRPKMMFIPEGGPEPVRLGVLGRGWLYRNALESSRFVTCLVDAQDEKAHRVYPDRIISGAAWEKRLRFRYDLLPARIGVPTLLGQVERFTRTQALIDEGAVVCALERYRLDKGQYPERLEDLIPAQLATLPHDLVTGGPLLYSRKGDSFKLYQVGWDGVDHDGTVGWTGEGAARKLDPARGDWVWPHASH